MYIKVEKFNCMQNKILNNVVLNDSKNEIYFETECGEEFIMSSELVNSKHVTIEEIKGDLNSIIGNKIQNFYSKSYESICIEDELTKITTYFNISTQKGSISLKWTGTANNELTEEVDFYKV